MVSIEKEIDNEVKYSFNKPFDCIDLKIGHSNDVLSKIEFDKRVVAWLDYDYGIDISMLTDLHIILENMLSGSFVIISYNSVPHKIGNLKAEFRNENGSHKELLLEKLKQMVTEDFVPLDVPKNGLSKPKVFSKIVKSIFEIKIRHILSEKNAALPEEEKWSYRQIMYFHYKDGADMGTIGWVFYQNRDASDISRSSFESSEFYSEDDPYQISIPNLTIKELNTLLNVMPLRDDYHKINLPNGVFEEEDIARFAKIYKYYPTFVNGDFF
jgi:hypothetical protein|nr:O-methyltransferase [uncultured Alteromonas sp.]